MHLFHKFYEKVARERIYREKRKKEEDLRRGRRRAKLGIKIEEEIEALT